MNNHHTWNSRLTACMLLSLGSMTGSGVCLASGTYATPLENVGQREHTTYGTIFDSTGEPVIGATVRVKGTSIGTSTDIDGKFSIKASPSATLIISYVGCETKEVKVAASPMSITLNDNTQDLNELVVVGFGTQKKVNLTGAVGVVTSDELAERPVANATQALQGLVPGLNIDINSGSLEKTPSINVRGGTTIGEGTSGSPLILIDGMEGDLNSINPQDIDNISVLKDAAASSIYGSRAPFGVILITTKAGGTDGKTKINYNNSFRFSTPINKKHMMNSVMFASWINDILTNNGGSPRFDEAFMNRVVTWHNATPIAPGQRMTSDGEIVYAIEARENGQWLGGFSTGADDVDYYDVVYKDWNFSQEHNVSASGGTKKFNYYASGSFYGNNGLIKIGDENLKRFTVTSKINSQLTNWLSLNLNLRFTREDYKRPADLTDNLYNNMASKAWPVLPLYDRNGHYVYNDGTSIPALAEGGEDKKQTDNFYIQTGLRIEPIKNWVTSVDFSYRVKSANRHWDSRPFYNHDLWGAPYVVHRTNSNVHEDFSKNNYYNFNARSQYSISINEAHNFMIMGGFQAENMKQTIFGLQRNGILIATKPEVDLTTGLGPDGSPITPSVNGQRNEWAVAGFFGRLNYDYKGRYLLEANVRADGSSRFRTGRQWRVFPSVSAGWNIAQEEFMQDNTWLNMLKLRASYGSLGNQNTNNWYYTYQTMSVNTNSGTWLQNGNKTNTAAAPGLVSESLTWEKVETWNIGLDWGLLNNRLTGSFDFYNRTTRDMVGAAPALPSILGTSVPKTNNTDLRAIGWELSVGWRDALPNGLTYSAKFLLSDSRTKILRYPNNPTNYIYSYMEGHYTNDIWGYETIDIARSDEEMRAHLEALDRAYEAYHGKAPDVPLQGQNHLGTNWKAGDIMYKDLDGDGRISKGSETIGDTGDKRVIGNSTPRFRFGLDLNAAWKGFDVRVFLQGVMKRDFWQGGTYTFGYINDLWAASGIMGTDDYFRDENTWSVKNGYQEANKDAWLPRPTGSKNTTTQTRYLENAAYMRLKNLQVGYTLPVKLTRSFGVEKLRFYFSGENLFTVTKLSKQFDPETIGSWNGNGYPLSSTLSFGLSLTL